MQSPDQLNAGTFVFHTHNYCPTCRESGKGDAPCITNQSPCNICANFSEEQQIKVKHRCRYVRKQKSSDPCDTSKDDDLDLLGDDVEAFSGSQADLEVAADIIFRHLHFPNSYVLNLCLSRLLKLSNQPQVLPCRIKWRED